MCFYIIVLMAFGTSKVQKTFFFILVTFLHQKISIMQAKDVNILYIKSGNNNRPSYFPISTPLRHHPLYCD
jgi:hypothetical protein